MDSESFDPFSSAGTEEPAGAADPFAADSETGSNDSGSAVKEQPLRIIRLRAVRAVEVHSIFENLFREEKSSPRWFLRTEAQSNSLIFKGPAEKFNQLKMLASELDRLATTPIDTQKKTQSSSIPHILDDDSQNGSQYDGSERPIRIIQLRFLKAHDFTDIAWDLVRSQNSKTQLLIHSEPATNAVILRGPVWEIAQVEQLALQLDQPAVGSAGGAFMDSSLDLPAGSANPDIFISNRNSERYVDNGPAVQTQRTRELIAGADQESVRVAIEIRSLQRQYSNNHPKLTEARQKLDDVLEQSFQLRLELQVLEITAIKSKLADIESRVQRRSQLRQEIINRRLHELLGEKDDLSWEVARTSSVGPMGKSEELPGLPHVERNQRNDFDRELIPDVVVPVGEQLPPPGTSSIKPGLESPDTPTDDSPRPELPTDEPETVQPKQGLAGKPILDEGISIVERPLRGDVSEQPGEAISLTVPTQIRVATFQQELIVAEHEVEVSSLKVDRIRSRLSKLKDSDQADELGYELQLATLELDQATKLLEQKHRWIKAQRNSQEVNIRYMEKSLALAKSEYDLMIETLKKSPGALPIAELRRQELEIQKTELRLEQAEADLDVFEVGNRTMQNAGSPFRSPEDLPAAKNSLVARPRPVPRDTAIDDSYGKDVAVEPEIALPETIVPTESLNPLSSPETPSVVPEPATKLRSS